MVIGFGKYVKRTLGHIPFAIASHHRLRLGASAHRRDPPTG